MNYYSCAYCNVIFERKRNTKQFCSLECKNKYNYAVRNGMPIPVKMYDQQRSENSQLIIDQKKIINQQRKEIGVLKDKVKALELTLISSERSKPQEEGLKVSAQDIDKLKEPKVTVTKHNKDNQPRNNEVKFLSKKERICESLLNNEINLVSKEELEALGYPCGFFDGWIDEEGEVLERYKIIYNASSQEYIIEFIH